MKIQGAVDPLFLLEPQVRALGHRWHMSSSYNIKSRQTFSPNMIGLFNSDEEFIGSAWPGAGFSV